MSGGGIVVFDYSAFISRFPEFSGVSQPIAQQYFNESGLYCDNTPLSPVVNLTERTVLLNYLTAHLAYIYSGTNGEAPSPLVGRIASAGEGSVNVSVDGNYATPGSMAWFCQSKYGAAWWQASIRYRSFRYRPAPSYLGPTAWGSGFRRW